jgi:hypothetical protein
LQAAFLVLDSKYAAVVIARGVRDEAIQFFVAVNIALDCFASLVMTMKAASF